MKINDIVTIKGHPHGVNYYIITHIVSEETSVGIFVGRAHLVNLKRFPCGWYNLDELEAASEQVLRCSLSSLANDLYNLKTAMKAMGYDTLRGLR